MLAYDRHGAGPALVLVHPLGADRRVWDPVVGRLAAQRDVIAVDLPGFGASPSLDGVPSPPALAEALARFLGMLGLERPHLAGNSLGGWVALELALGGHARSVTAIAPAGLWAQPLMPKRGVARRLARAALPIVDRLARSVAGRRVLLAGTVTHPERVPPDAAARLVRAYATAPGFRAANDAMRAGRFTGIDRIRTPVTLAWPEHDRLVSRPAQLPPRVHSVELPGCGHIPMWDDPNRVAGLLLAGSADRTPGSG